MNINIQPRGFRTANAALRNNPKKLKKLQKRGLQRIALIGINIIQDRTADGQGYKDGAFKPYSESYAEFRAKKNRTLIPNLTMTGQMLAAMTSKANHKRAEIFFRGKNASGKAAYNNKTRPFFGFSRNEEQRLLRAFERFIK